MARVDDVLDQVDGLRRDAADRVKARFSSVSALASATTEELTEISGIGKVMADRIHAVAAGAKGGAASARASASDAKEKAATRAKQGAERAASTASTASARGRETADEAKGLVGKAAGTAKGVVDKATGPARKVVDKVRKRGS